MKRIRVLLTSIPVAVLAVAMLRKLMRREERSFRPVVPGEGERETPRSEEAMLTDVGASITPEGGAEAAGEAPSPSGTAEEDRSA